MRRATFSHKVLRPYLETSLPELVHLHRTTEDGEASSEILDELNRRQLYQSWASPMYVILKQVPEIHDIRYINAAVTGHYILTDEAKYLLEKITGLTYDAHSLQWLHSQHEEAYPDLAKALVASFTGDQIASLRRYAIEALILAIRPTTPYDCAVHSRDICLSGQLRPYANHRALEDVANLIAHTEPNIYHPVLEPAAHAFGFKYIR